MESAAPSTAPPVDSKLDMALDDIAKAEKQGNKRQSLKNRQPKQKAAGRKDQQKANRQDKVNKSRGIFTSHYLEGQQQKGQSPGRPASGKRGIQSRLGIYARLGNNPVVPPPSTNGTRPKPGAVKPENVVVSFVNKNAQIPPQHPRQSMIIDSGKGKQPKKNVQNSVTSNANTSRLSDRFGQIRSQQLPKVVQPWEVAKK